MTWDWIPLISDLSAEHADWTVWKHVESALSGDGDIDAAAPFASWAAVTTSLASIAASRTDATHLTWCDHVPDVRLHFLVSPSSWPILREVDVASSCSKLGVRWAHAEDLVALSVLTADGYRAVRPGAQALVEAVLYGIDRFGAYRPSETSAARIDLGVAADAEGAQLSADRLVPPGMRLATRKVAKDLTRGRRPAASAKLLAASALVRSACVPEPALRRVAFRTRPKCALFELAMSGRRSNSRIGEFLEDLEGNHELVEIS